MPEKIETALDAALPGKSRCRVIAEVAQSHDGSLGQAYAFVDAAARAGADAIKFQTHIAAAESTLDEPWRVRFSHQDESRFAYWKRMEFTAEQWAGLAQHARAAGLVFLSSPFSVTAVELLDRVGMPVWKIASGEVTNPELLDAIWRTRAPILFSSGMSLLRELDTVVAQTRARGIDVGVFQCTSEYPCPPEAWGLNLLAEFRSRFDCQIGLSDHSGNIYAGFAACALGADFLEVHLTLSRRMFGPDVPSSLDVEDFTRLTEGIRQIDNAFAHPLSKDDHATRMGTMRSTFGRSLTLKETLPAGTVLRADHLTLKKPGGGLPFSRRDEVIGRALRHEKASDRILSLEDLV